MCEEVVVWAIRNKSGDPEQDYFKAELFCEKQAKNKRKYQTRNTNTQVLKHEFGDIGEKTTR
jgi:hypothetical protein